MKSLRELLTGRVPMTIKSSASALDAARTMREQGIGCLLIVDAEKRPIGIFTERDLMVRIVVEGKAPARVPVEEAMSKSPFTADVEQRVRQVSREMRQRHIRHLPVTENGVLIGVLSLRDLLAAHLEERKHEVEALTAYIQGEGEALQS